MNIISYFSESGVPKTGLTPTITIRKLDGTVVVNSQNLKDLNNLS